MQSADNFESIVRKTFVDRAIRSALLVDDQFPRFDEILDKACDYEKQYKESDRAALIYKMFRDRRILCDVENSLTNIDSSSMDERVRKSDFILLDYHLTADEKEISHSIGLLKRLAITPHFNTVVVYTKHPDLKDVWLNIAVNLKGGWKKASKILDGELIDQWDELEGESQLPTVDDKMLVDCLAERDHNIFRSTLGRKLRKEFEARGIDKKDASSFIISSVHALARKRLVEETQELESALVGSCVPGGPIWLQSGNVFIAIVKKSLEEDAPENPNEIFEKLSAALVDWNPNIVQILLSEIQNILELGGLAADEEYTGTPERQTGIGYHLLSLLPPSYTAGDISGVDSAITSSIKKITESIQNRVAFDANILDITRKLIEPMVASAEWAAMKTGRKERVAPLVEFTKSVLSQSKGLKNENIFIDLNIFLSTERFGGINVSTGTVFSNSDQSAWWLCCSPSCDMAPRPPSEEQKWLTNINPAKSMIALQLEPIVSKEVALRNAEHGNAIFIRGSDGECRHFNVFPANNQPAWEVMLVADHGKVKNTDDKYHFTGKRIQGHVGDGEDGPIICEAVVFRVEAQLRPEYSARLLQMTGQHLSRIGVDFVNLPQ